MSIFRAIRDFYGRTRGAGHTELMIEGIVEHLLDHNFPFARVVVWAVSMREGERIRHRVVEELEKRGCRLGDIKKQIIIASAQSARSHEHHLIAQHVPAAFDNSAILEMCDEAIANEQRIAAMRLNNLAACISAASVFARAVLVNPLPRKKPRSP